MRETFGGTFMLQLSLVFLVIYVAFMAVAINYAKTFRVKNGVINIIEQHTSVVGKDGQIDSSTQTAINNYLDKVGYRVSDITAQSEECSKEKGTFLDRGVCIIPMSSGNDPYYVVYTYIAIDFPFFNLSMRLKVSGETETFSDWRK